MENFGSGMGRVGSIRVSSPLSGEHISDVGSGMGPGRSVRVSGFGSVLPGLPTARHFNCIIRVYFISLELPALYWRNLLIVIILISDYI